MARIGYARVSTDRQNLDRQLRDLKAAGCERIYEEKISGGKATADRPQLAAALDYMRAEDVLVVQEVDRLGRNLLDGLITLSDLFAQGITVEILTGIAAGVHTERTLVLDLALALAEDQRRNLRAKVVNGLEAAKARGTRLGRPLLATPELGAQAAALRDTGMSLRKIAASVFVTTASGEVKNPSKATVIRALAEHDARAASTPAA